MKNFYTYIHKKASDGSVFYVGKGTANRARKPHDRSNWWHKTAEKHGFTFEICAQWGTESEAFEHEKFLIWCFRDMGAALVNLTDGGDGPSGYKHTEKTKALLSEKTKAYALNPANQEKIKATKTKQKQWSEAARKRASLRAKHIWTEEARLKHSNTLKQTYSSDAMKDMQKRKSPIVTRRKELEEKRSEAVKKYWLSEAALSTEAKIKRSEARKKSWETRRKNALN